MCSRIGEAYRKRLYRAHFISKCSDADSENGETQVWLDFSFACQYISKKEYDNLIDKSEEVGRLINHMIVNPENYLSTADKENLRLMQNKY